MDTVEGNVVAEAPMADTVVKEDAAPVVKQKGTKGKPAVKTKKASPKKAKKEKKQMSLKLAKRAPGPAMKALAPKVKETKTPGVCMKKGCSTKTPSSRSKWCRTHKKEIRKAQLAANNIVWKKRVLNKQAGHHVAYRNEPTQWTLTHKEKALEIVKKGRSVYEPAKFKQILAKAKSA